MSTTVRHVLGISGGKDSAALAIYLKNKYQISHVVWRKRQEIKAMSSLSRPPLEDIQGDRIHCDQRPDHAKDPDD